LAKAFFHALALTNNLLGKLLNGDRVSSFGLCLMDWVEKIKPDAKEFLRFNKL